MITNPRAKINFSDKDKTILSINHNYYVRTAIATLADIFLTSMIFLLINIVIAALLFGLFYLMSRKMNGRQAEQLMPVYVLAVGAITALMSIIFFIYVIVKIARISTMRKHVNRIERGIVENCTASSEAPKAE